jgi:hypothetical protein
MMLQAPDSSALHEGGLCYPDNFLTVSHLSDILYVNTSDISLS